MSRPHIAELSVKDLALVSALRFDARGDARGRTYRTLSSLASGANASTCSPRTLK